MLTLRHLERCFRQAIGMGPHEFSVRLRLRHAHWMTQHTRLPLSQIALECGFGDSAGFSRRSALAMSDPLALPTT